MQILRRMGLKNPYTIKTIYLKQYNVVELTLSHHWDNDLSIDIIILILLWQFVTPNQPIFMSKKMLCDLGF